MSGIEIGALLGATAGCGVLLVADHALRRRRPTLEERVAPYVGSLQPRASNSRLPAPQGPVAARLLGPTINAAAERLDVVLGGRASLTRRLERRAARARSTSSASSSSRGVPPVSVLRSY